MGFINFLRRTKMINELLIESIETLDNETFEDVCDLMNV